jgi:mono/diheme cytochrome c family protein
MRWTRIAVAAGCLGLAACRGGGDEAGGMQHDMSAMEVDTVGLRAKPVPAEFAAGQQLFDSNCAACHGGAALGTAQGPPLVHIYYEPNHHADMAFQMAVGNGVQQHHWNFGNMPPIPSLGPADVDRILGYVRWLQREAGVY